jgi:uncharacterized membrane protein YraQ (UPF0718 family)
LSAGPHASGGPEGGHACCRPSVPAGPSGAGFKNTRKTFIMVSAAAAILAASAAVDALRPLGHHLAQYLKMIVPAVAAGLLIGGLIDRYVPHWYVERLMAGTRKRSIARSVLIGFFMSACCHGVLAVAMELYRKGASTASVIAFLLASPWANLPLTVLLFGFFGAKALVFVIGALLIAFVTGTAFLALEKVGWVESNPNRSGTAHTGPIVSDIGRRFTARRWTAANAAADARAVFRGALKLADMILWWVILGAIAASLAGAYIPQDWMRAHLGPDIKGLLLTLAGASVLEVCSEGTAPLAFEIHRQTQAFGNALVFLMAGVATDYTEIGLIWQTIGRRAAILLPLIAVPQILLLGILANKFF